MGFQVRASRSHLRGSLVVLAPLTLLALVRCSEFEASSVTEEAGAPSDEAGVPDDAGPDVGTCSRTPYALGQRIERGSVCGVGGCRVVLSGECPRASLDGSPPSVCVAAFPPESCATPTDDNCDGVLDEGCEGTAPAAGTACVACAAGRRVKRGADGTISGQFGTYQDDFTTTDCINSALCGFGEARWVRHMAGVGIDCEQFCRSISGTCVEECTTSQPECSPLAASVNQGGKRFGTYTSDYGCMQKDTAETTTSTPNTGDCRFIPKDYGFGPLADNRFTYRCCCKL